MLTLIFLIVSFPLIFVFIFFLCKSKNVKNAIKCSIANSNKEEFSNNVSKIGAISGLPGALLFIFDTVLLCLYEIPTNSRFFNSNYLVMLYAMIGLFIVWIPLIFIIHSKIDKKFPSYVEEKHSDINIQRGYNLAIFLNGYIPSILLVYSIYGIILLSNGIIL